MLAGSGRNHAAVDSPSMVKSTIETLDDNKIKMSVEVDDETMSAAESEAFKQIAKQVQLPGFRRGKVPRRVIESHFGKGVARGQAIEEAVPEAFLKAAAEHELDFIGPPDYDITDGVEEGTLTFDAVVEVRPQINVGGYDGLRVEIPSPFVTEDEISEQIDQVRGQFGELEDVDRAAEPGDRVTIDIEGTHDGEPVEGLTASDYLYEVGSGFVVAELDEHLDGSSAGDAINFDAEHPDPDTEGDLTFDIQVKSVQAMKLPDLDDEFVKDATEFETVEEFRNDISTRLGRSKVEAANTALSNGTAEALGQLVTDDIPDVLIDQEATQRVQNLAWQIQSQGMDFEQYLQFTGSTVEELREQMREPSEGSVKVDLALRAVATAEGLDPTEAEIDEEFEALAGQYGQPAADLKERLAEANQMVSIRADIAKRKAVDWLMERVEIVDPQGEAVDREALEVEEEDQDQEGHDPTGHDDTHDDGEEE